MLRLTGGIRWVLFISNCNVSLFRNNIYIINQNIIIFSHILFYPILTCSNKGFISINSGLLLLVLTELIIIWFYKIWVCKYTYSVQKQNLLIITLLFPKWLHFFFYSKKRSQVMVPTSMLKSLSFEIKEANWGELTLENYRI